MAAITRPVLEGRAQLVLAWLAVLIPLAWGIRAAKKLLHWNSPASSA